MPIKPGFRYFKAPSGAIHAVRTKEDGTLHTVLFETGPHAVMYTFTRLRPIAFQIEKVFCTKHAAHPNRHRLRPQAWARPESHVECGKLSELA